MTARTTCLALAAAACLLAQPAHANDRPYESARTAVSEDDDQVWSFEVWAHRLGSVRSVTVEPDYAFDPANSVQVELTRRLDRRGQETGHEAELEFKHIFNRIARDGWGWALSAALGAERSDGRTVRTLTVRVPVSVDLGPVIGLESGPLLHLNLGLHKASESRRAVAQAVAMEQPLFKHALLFAEWARDGDQRVAQLGVRHWVRREKLAVDFAWQQQRVPGERSNGWVAGIGWYDL